MATDPQRAANQANAQRSTGPVTDQGKDHSRRNALKHGLSGRGVVLPEDLEFAARVYAEDLGKSLRPASPFAQELTMLLARDLVRANNIAQRQEMRRCELAWRALEYWDDDRRDDALILAEDLGRRPTAVATRLQHSPQGCRVLIEFWTALREAPEVWTADQRRYALDLLGVPPDLRSGPTRVDVVAGAEPVAHQRALAAAELARLEALARGRAAQRDEFDRTADEYGIGETDPELRLLVRYERECARRIVRLRKMIAEEPAAESSGRGQAAGAQPAASASERRPPRLDTRPVLPDPEPEKIPTCETETIRAEIEAMIAQLPASAAASLAATLAPLGCGAAVAERPGG